jgi:hypothetical protein
VYVFLMMAALAVGSADGRDAATDGRTEEHRSLRNRLRVGMSWRDVRDLLDREIIPIQMAKVGSNHQTPEVDTYYFGRGRDVFGRRHPPVLLLFDDEDCLRDWKVLPLVDQLRLKLNRLPD